MTELTDLHWTQSFMFSSYNLYITDCIIEGYPYYWGRFGAESINAVGSSFRQIAEVSVPNGNFSQCTFEDSSIVVFEGDVRIVNCTVSGSMTEGVYATSYGRLTLVNTTISRNHRGILSGSAIEVRLLNTIVADNLMEDVVCYSPMVSEGHNLIGNPGARVRA